MADRYDDLQRQVEDLRQKVNELLDRPQQLVLGSRANPVKLIYLLDDRTGAVAEVRYDRANTATRVSEVS